MQPRVNDQPAHGGLQALVRSGGLDLTWVLLEKRFAKHFARRREVLSEPIAEDKTAAGECCATPCAGWAATNGEILGASKF
jgi:hypothetical protein